LGIPGPAFCLGTGGNLRILGSFAVFTLSLEKSAGKVRRHAVFAQRACQGNENPLASVWTIPGRSSGRPIQEPPADALSLQEQVPNDFESLVRIFQSNERLFASLRILDGKLLQAKTYLAEPGCNKSLGIGYVAHLKAKRSWTLAVLRANRLEAWSV